MLRKKKILYLRNFAILMLLVCICMVPLMHTVHSEKQQKTDANYSLKEKGFTLTNKEDQQVKVILENRLKMYEPKEEIKYEFKMMDDSSTSIKGSLTINVWSMDVDMNGNSYLEKTITYDTITGNIKDKLTISDSGSYRFEAILTDEDKIESGSVFIGVMPKNEGIKDDTFFWGIETRLARIHEWDNTTFPMFEDNVEPSEKKEQSYNIVIDYIDYLGVNMVRDTVAFSTIKPEVNKDYNFDLLNKIIKSLNGDGREITLDWVVSSTPVWAVDPDYSNSMIELSNPKPWAVSGKYPPAKEPWIDFMRELQKYSDNDKIIYEIGNEPNHTSFWCGTIQEYLQSLSDASLGLHTKEKEVSKENDSTEKDGIELIDFKGKVMNGGMLVDVTRTDRCNCVPKDLQNANGEITHVLRPDADFYKDYIKKVLDNKEETLNSTEEKYNELDYIAIHGHGGDIHLQEIINNLDSVSSDEFIRKNIMDLRFSGKTESDLTVDEIKEVEEQVKKVRSAYIINESGYSTDNWEVQAANIVFKATYAKSRGMRGFSAYALVVLPQATSDQEKKYEMISPNLEPKPAYMQYMAVINKLQNTELVDEQFNVLEENGKKVDKGYVTFKREDGTHIRMYFNATPEDFNHSLETAKRYDAYGNENSKKNTIITYYEWHESGQH